MESLKKSEQADQNNNLTRTTHDTRLQSSNKSLVAAAFNKIRAVNMLVGYPMPLTEMQDWAVSLVTITPNIDLEAVGFVMKKFAMEELVWDKSKGIQNIYIGLKRVRMFDGKFELFTPHDY